MAEDDRSSAGSVTMPSLTASGTATLDMSAEEFGAFLHEQKALSPCPACGSTDWLGETKPGDPHTMQPVYLLASPRPTWDNLKVAAAAYIVTCQNCGFIRLHNQAMVKRHGQ